MMAIASPAPLMLGKFEIAWSCPISLGNAPQGSPAKRRRASRVSMVKGLEVLAATMTPRKPKVARLPPHFFAAGTLPAHVPATKPRLVPVLRRKAIVEPEHQAGVRMAQ